MKIIPFAPLLLALQFLAVPTWAGTINEADYTVQYEVMNASKKGCSMTLLDRAKPNVGINVARKGPGPCVLDNGKVFHGRENQKKNEIELVIPGGKGKSRVEDWQILGTVDINPTLRSSVDAQNWSA